MTLYDLIQLVNENCIVDVYSASTNERIAIYDGRDSIDEEFNDCEVTDIFTGITESIGIKPIPILCVEIQED